MHRLIVVGSGVAGLTAALTARAAGAEVTVVTKSDLTESNSFYAQGGVAAALWEDDTVAAHVSDTLRAGAGLCDPEAVRVLCEEGPVRIRELIGLGTPFDRAANGTLARGLEAAHSSPRILHAGGDATGAAIETTLARALQDSGVDVLSHAFLADLVVSEGTVHGVRILAADGTIAELDADTVIIASGGAGQLFQHTTNPVVATGDGIAAAWRAGATITDAEFYQFHPTALALHGAGAKAGSFLVSEAVRGEGATLINARGERFMLDVHPDAELAPRDVVARGIAVEMAAQGGEPVRLDATRLGRAFLESRFPTIDAACHRAGVDWASDPIPVTPAAHYWMGGIATDTNGRTTLAGLYAVGEAACTGAHGANRLASNSLLEALVFARRAAVDAAHGGPERWEPDVVHALETDAPWDASPVLDAPFAPLLDGGGSAGSAGPARPHGSDGSAGSAASAGSAGPAGSAASAASAGSAGAAWSQGSDGSHGPDGLASSHGSASGSGDVDRAALQSLMWQAVGLHRTRAGLEDALARLRALTPERGPSVGAPALEDANLIDLARLCATAALARRESRGAHFRTDYPTCSPDAARRLAWAGKVSVPC